LPKDRASGDLTKMLFPLFDHVQQMADLGSRLKLFFDLCFELGDLIPQFALVIRYE
jgi:hypothetical protein